MRYVFFWFFFHVFRYFICYILSRNPSLSLPASSTLHSYHTGTKAVTATACCLRYCCSKHSPLLLLATCNCQPPPTKWTKSQDAAIEILNRTRSPRKSSSPRSLPTAPRVAVRFYRVRVPGFHRIWRRFYPGIEDMKNNPELLFNPTHLADS